MGAHGVRVVLSLGRPDPDRLSTTLLWSLAAHAGLLAAAIVAQMLPSPPEKPGTPHFVTLAAPGRPAAGGGGGRPEPEPPKPQAAPTPPPPQPAPEPPALPPRAPTKASVPTDKPPKPAPAPRAHEPAPAQPSHDEPSTDATTETTGGGAPGAAPGPGGGGAAGDAGGVGGTSFGEGDFRFGWYQSAVESKLQSSWRRPMGGSEIQTATVSFTILRNGAVRDVAVITPSGSSALDLSAMRAVYDATPLPPLPRGWSGDSVHVTIEFSLRPSAP